MDNYGFVRDKLNIKCLILFILKRLPAPVGRDMLTELTLIDNATNYFDYIECLTELERSGLIIVTNEMYRITPIGIRDAEEMEDKVPYTVRMKALAGTERAAKILERESLIKTRHAEKPEGGYKVTLSLSDSLGEMLKMDVLAGNEKQAEEMERRFRKNAESIYIRITSLLTEDQEEDK